MRAIGGPRRFDALADGWLARLVSANTRDAYRRDLTAFRLWCLAEGLAPLGVGTIEITRYRDACVAGGVGPATIARRLSALSSFFDHAVAARAIAANPVVSVARPASYASAHAVLLATEAAALYKSATTLGPKVAVLVALLLHEGMKLSEALALDIERLEHRGRRMRATIVGRSAPRIVVLDQRTAHAITRYVGDRVTGPLLVGDSPTQRQGNRLTRFGADFLLKRAAEHAGLNRQVSANTLRGSYITLAHLDGRTVEEIRRRVGHASARDTRRYLAREGSVHPKVRGSAAEAAL